MKKLVFLLAVFSLFAINVKAQSSQSVKWPFTAATGYTIANNGTSALTFTNTMNYPSSVQTLTANATISVTAGTGLKAGSVLLVTVKTTSTETTTFAGSIVAPVVTGVAGKTWSQSFIYNGSNFYPCGAKIQVD